MKTCRRNLSMQPTHVSCMSRLCHPHTAALLHLRRWLLSSASSELQRRGSSCCCSRKACLACRLLIYVPCTRLHVHMHACMRASIFIISPAINQDTSTHAHAHTHTHHAYASHYRVVWSCGASVRRRLTLESDALQARHMRSDAALLCCGAGAF